MNVPPAERNETGTVERPTGQASERPHDCSPWNSWNALYEMLEESAPSTATLVSTLSRDSDEDVSQATDGTGAGGGVGDARDEEGRMSDHSAIEWTDATWNPTTGCTKISPGCSSCGAS